MWIAMLLWQPFDQRFHVLATRGLRGAGWSPLAIGHGGDGGHAKVQSLLDAGLLSDGVG